MGQLQARGLGAQGCQLRFNLGSLEAHKASMQVLWVPHAPEIELCCVWISEPRITPHA